jgi:predicted PurR-regulated permease PerM
MIVVSLIIGFVIAFTYNPEVSNLKDKIANNGKAMVITIVLLSVITVAFFGIFWLFYRLLYGILLRRLYVNYKELKKIDL